MAQGEYASICEKQEEGNCAAALNCVSFLLSAYIRSSAAAKLRHHAHTAEKRGRHP
jgi:hypothetical protein